MQGKDEKTKETSQTKVKGLVAGKRLTRELSNLTESPPQ